MAGLRTASASQGVMLASLSERLSGPGGVHFGSPDKRPEARLETLRLAGELRVPFTTGILIGIGETRAERLEALFAIRDLHRRFGHVQEVIVQNFRAKPGTTCGRRGARSRTACCGVSPPPRDPWPDDEYPGAPNLSLGVYPRLIAGGSTTGAGSPGHPVPSIRRRRGLRSPSWPGARPPRASSLFRLPIYPAYARDLATGGSGRRQAGAPLERRRGFRAGRRWGAGRSGPSGDDDPRPLG